MAILDYDNVLSLAQAVTTAAATPTTNVIDFQAAHVGARNKIICTVNAAVTSGGAATVTFAIQTDDNADFSSATTLYTSEAIAKDTLVAGYKVFEFTLPWETEHYVRGVITPAVADLTAGKFNMWVDSVAQTNGLT
jgi:hypothetical protein